MSKEIQRIYINDSNYANPTYEPSPIFAATASIISFTVKCSVNCDFQIDYSTDENYTSIKTFTYSILANTTYNKDIIIETRYIKLSILNIASNPCSLIVQSFFFENGISAGNLENIGGFAELYKSPNELRTLQSSDGSITITQNSDNIDFVSAGGGGGSNWEIVDTTVLSQKTPATVNNFIWQSNNLIIPNEIIQHPGGSANNAIIGGSEHLIEEANNSNAIFGGYGAYIANRSSANGAVCSDNMVAGGYSGVISTSSAGTNVTCRYNSIIGGQGAFIDTNGTGTIIRYNNIIGTNTSSIFTTVPSTATLQFNNIFGGYLGNIQSTGASAPLYCNLYGGDTNSITNNTVNSNIVGGANNIVTNTTNGIILGGDASYIEMIGTSVGGYNRNNAIVGGDANSYISCINNVAQSRLEKSIVIGAGGSLETRNNGLIQKCAVINSDNSSINLTGVATSVSSISNSIFGGESNSIFSTTDGQNVFGCSIFGGADNSVDGLSTNSNVLGGRQGTITNADDNVIIGGSISIIRRDSTAHGAVCRMNTILNSEYGTISTASLINPVTCEFNSIIGSGDAYITADGNNSKCWYNNIIGAMQANIATYSTGANIVEDSNIFGGTAHELSADGGTTVRLCNIFGGRFNRITNSCINSQTLGGWNFLINNLSGCVMIGDNNSNALSASVANEYTSRFSGGYRVYSNATATTGMTMAAGGSSWVAVSDRNKKDIHGEVNYNDYLEKLENIPVYEYNYKGNCKEQRCIGPMAQDYHEWFGCDKIEYEIVENIQVGEEVFIFGKDKKERTVPKYEQVKKKVRQPAKDPLGIDQGDLLGIAIACIKALDKQVKELNERVKELESRIL